jgi:hypothetical protein
MDIVHQKAELKDWIDTITDESILEEILAIKSQSQFDFEKEWARSISGDELRLRTKNHINNLLCQKQ